MHKKFITQAQVNPPRDGCEGPGANDHRVYCRGTPGKPERRVELHLQAICGLRGCKELVEESDAYWENKSMTALYLHSF